MSSFHNVEIFKNCIDLTGQRIIKPDSLLTSEDFASKRLEPMWKRLTDQALGYTRIPKIRWLKPLLPREKPKILAMLGKNRSVILSWKL